MGRRAILFPAMREAKGTTLLVVGGGGFLGSAIASAAALRGMETHVTWRTSPPDGRLPAHRVRVDDLEQIGALVQEVEPDVVVNAIGGPHRPSDVEQRRAVWRDSPVATWSLLEACSGRVTKLVHLASSHEYAPSDFPHDESSRVGPVSLRGIAAVAATSAVRHWGAETGTPTVILRPFAVYGPREPDDRVVPTVLRAARHGEPFRTTAASTVKDFVFVEDVAAAVIISCLDEVTDEFNLGSGRGTTILELVDAAESVTGRRIEVVEGEFEPRPWDRAVWVSNPSKAAAILGWKADTSLIEGLRRCLR